MTQQQATTETTLDLTGYDVIVVNSSGGKDSQTALDRVVRMADQQGISRDKIVVFHADLGDMEWEGTRELAQEQAEHYGLRFISGQYRTKDGEELDLLQYVEKRGMWPSSQARFCTSEFKRSPGTRAITQVHREAGSPKGFKVLNVFGFRAEESPARAKREVFCLNKRASTKSRTVYDWLPIHDMKEGQVWDSIKASGVRHHKAYDLGMPRLSCAFCIFAPKGALVTAGHHNKDLLNRYVETEKKIGHSFRKDLPILEVLEAVEAGEQGSPCEGGCWNM